MADATQKWHDAERQILEALDIKSEYESLGLRVVNSRPTAKGFLQARADGRDDNSPSAGICIAGPMLGLYRDQTRAPINFFVFAAEKRFGGDRRAARKFYAEKTGVKLPRSEEPDLPLDKLHVTSLTYSSTLNYTAKKTGVTREAIERAGGMQGHWPKGAPPEGINYVLAFPMFGAPLTDGEPIGWHLVTQNPDFKLKVYQGPNVPVRLEKSISVGSVGLMGQSALDNFAEAEVVWFVEGISDMLALEAIVPQDGKHVVTTTGGCSAHLRPEWLPNFAGKDVRIVYDVGDPKDEGQTGAKVQLGLLLPVASTVRNVVLPLGPEDPAKPGSRKNDLRAWLNAGHTFDDLCNLAAACVPVSPENPPPSIITPEQALLNSMGCIVTGQIDGSDTVEVFSTVQNKRTTIRDIDKLTYNKAVLAFGGDVCAAQLNDSPNVSIPGRATIQDLRKAIVVEAAKNILTDTDTLGQGIWRVGERLVLIGRAEAYSINGCPELEPSRTPAVGGKRINFSTTHWFDCPKLKQYLQHAMDPGWCKSTVDELIRVFNQWDNWAHPENARLAASLAMASWMQTVWPVRPLVSVIGPTNSGKSHVFDHALSPFFGSLVEKFSKPTEAAVRQKVKDTAKVLLIDEFEADPHHRRAVMEMLRTATKGDRIIRGGANGRAVDYGLRHIVWVGGIELGLDKAADWNRYVVLELKEVPKGSGGKMQLPSHEGMTDLGHRALAVVLRRWKQALDIYGAIRSQGVPHLDDRRLIEVFGVPCAMFAAATGGTAVDAWEFLDVATRDRGFKEETVADETELLRDILSASVQLPGGVRRTVGQILSPGGLDHHGAAIHKGDLLESVGIRKDPDGSIFFAGKLIREHLLKTSPLGTSGLHQILRRLNPPNVTKRGTESQRIGGGIQRGVRVCYEVIAAQCPDYGRAEFT